MPPTYKKKEPERRKMLDEGKKEQMLAILLRNEQAFQGACEFLTPEKFDDRDKAYAVIWRIAHEHYKKHNVLPGYNAYRVEIDQINSGKNNTFFENGAYEQIAHFLPYMFDPQSFDGDPCSPQNASYANEILKEFLQERLFATTHDMQVNATLPADLPAMFDALSSEMLQLSALTSQDVGDALPDGWDNGIKLEMFDTQIDYLQPFLGKGHAPGEVYGLLGPFGSAKTTISVQLAVKTAEFFSQQKSGRPKVVIFAHYEAGVAEMRQRTLGCAARICRSTLENMTSIAESFSRRNSLKDYEKYMFKADLAANRVVPGEFERAVNAREWLNKHLVLLDMSGDSRHGAGSGGVAELARDVRKICQQRGVDCGLLVLDYVMAMVESELAAKNQDHRELRFKIKSVPMALKKQIAIPFKCPVWVMQQLSGEANNFTSANLANHTNAGECRSFAENLDFCFVVGKPDSGNYMAIGATKHRRRPPHDNIVTRVDGEMYRVIDCSKTHKIQTKNQQKKIVALAELSSTGLFPPGAVPGAGPSSMQLQN